jgi:hypothetical protein
MRSASRWCVLVLTVVAAIASIATRPLRCMPNRWLLLTDDRSFTKLKANRSAGTQAAPWR